MFSIRSARDRNAPSGPWRVRESASGIGMECPAKSLRAVADQRQFATGTDTPMSQIAPHRLGHFHATDCRIRWLRQTRTGLENRSRGNPTGGSNPPLSASKVPGLANAEMDCTCEPRFPWYPPVVQVLSRAGFVMFDKSIRLAMTLDTPSMMLMVSPRIDCVRAFRDRVIDPSFHLRFSSSVKIRPRPCRARTEPRS